jgi:uncharacterized protein
MVRKIEGRGPAPVHLWDPPFCGDMDMRIARDGTWFHEGKPIRRQALVELFASVLKRENDEYFLVTPVEKVRIQVEDCPFVIIDMEAEEKDGQQLLTFTTNTGEKFLAGKGHPLRIEVHPETGEPHPILHVRNGLNGLINRAVFYRLMDLTEQRLSDSGQSSMGIWSNGEFFALDEQGSIASVIKKPS